MKGHSPIRTLSEDRTHVSLRLGTLPTDDSPLPILAKTISKAEGKKPTRAPSTRAPTARRVRSPAKGITLNKSRILNQGSPKRKPGMNPKERGKASATGDRPTTTLIPAISKKRADFQTAPGSLP